MCPDEYIGSKVELQGQTALTQWVEDRFLVQWDNLENPESNGWHEYDPDDFVALGDEHGGF